ncbi:MAG: DMT family transporter [Anaerolineaceae bacterium]|nr:DMT family transporter [Anaerolineaceae bacterium]
MNKKLLGNILLTVTAMIWGTAFVFQRKGNEAIEPLTFTASRMTLAAAAVGGVALFFRLKERKDPSARTEEEERNSLRYSVMGGICCGAFLAAASIFQQIGMVTTTAGKAGFITAMYMLLVPVINFVFFGKKNSWLVWLAVGIGVAGMYLLCMTGGLRLTHGDTMVCICAFFFSGHILSCDYFVKRGNPILISAIQFAVCSAISWAAAFLLEQPEFGNILTAAIPILYCGIISGGVGYTLQIVAQEFTDPTIASLLMSLESVFALLAGAVILHESMTTRELLGCIFMFTAIILVQIPEKK